MVFTLQGFSHRNSVRIFQFLRVDSAFVRTRFTVDVDLKSLAEFHIPMQEAPLLCLQLLENRPEEDSVRRLALTKDDMHRFAAARVAATTRTKSHSAQTRTADVNKAASPVAFESRKA